MNLRHSRLAPNTFRLAVSSFAFGCRIRPVKKNRVPWGIHLLTAIHGVGALALVIMAVGCALSEKFRLSLIASPGSALMMEWFGPNVWIFLLLIASLLSALCYGSWRLRGWTRPLTIICYSIGVFGGLWEVWIGIPAGFLAAAINGGVVAYACTSQVKAAYGQNIRGGN